MNFFTKDQNPNLKNIPFLFWGGGLLEEELNFVFLQRIQINFFLFFFLGGGGRGNWRLE